MNWKRMSNQVKDYRFYAEVEGIKLTEFLIAFDPTRYAPAAKMLGGRVYNVIGRFFASGDIGKASLVKCVIDRDYVQVGRRKAMDIDREIVKYVEREK